MAGTAIATTTASTPNRALPGGRRKAVAALRARDRKSGSSTSMSRPRACACSSSDWASPVLFVHGTVGTRRMGVVDRRAARLSLDRPRAARLGAELRDRFFGKEVQGGGYDFLRGLRAWARPVGPWGLTYDEKARRHELARQHPRRESDRARPQSSRPRRCAAPSWRRPRRPSAGASVPWRNSSSARAPAKLDGVRSTKGWARLLEDRVETSKGTIPLSASVVADISTSGNLAIGGRRRT